MSLGRTTRLPTSTCSFLPECCSRCTVLIGHSKVLLSWSQDTIGVPLYTQGMWELKYLLVLSNAQPFERGLPICSKYVEDPQEASDILDVRGRTTQSSGCIASKVMTTPMFIEIETCLYLKTYKNFQNLYDTPFIPLYSTF